MVELPAEAFAVCRSVCDVFLEDHVSHLVGGLPAQLSDNDLQAGGEDIGGKLRLGAPGVDPCPPVLCYLHHR